jgi:hypothetical protein
MKLTHHNSFESRKLIPNVLALHQPVEKQIVLVSFYDVHLRE